MKRALTVGGIVLVIAPLAIVVIYVLSLGILAAGLIGLAYLWLWRE